MFEEDPCGANRKMWDETAAIHERVALPSLLERVGEPDFSTFDCVERRLFEQIGLEQKDVVQLACNNARELISIKKAGARRCVGFDISEAFLDQGRRLAEAGGVHLELVRANVYEIPRAYFDSFQVAYVSVGALGWLPDVERFFALVSNLLRPGGHLVVYEMHPVLFLYDEERSVPEDPRISRSYFRKEPLRFEQCRDYFDSSAMIRAPSYWYQHTMGAILSSVLAADLSVIGFQEYPHDVSGSYAKFEGQRHTLPMSYSLVAHKSSGGHHPLPVSPSRGATSRRS